MVTDPNNSGAGLGEKETSASKAQVTNPEKIDTPSGSHHAGLSTGTSPDRKNTLDTRDTSPAQYRDVQFLILNELDLILFQLISIFLVPFIAEG